MHRNKTFAGIFLIFSIANVTIVLAAPALIRQRHFVTERADDEPTGESKQDPAGLVHGEVGPAASPPPVGLPDWKETPPTVSEVSLLDNFLNNLANLHSDADSERTVPNSLSGSNPRPAASLPPVGLPEWKETSPTVSEVSLFNNFLKNLPNLHSDADSARTASSSSSGSDQGLPVADSEGTASSSPSGSHQGSPASELTGFNSPSGSHPGSPEPWWLQDHLPPLGTWDEGYTASHGQMLPPASVAQPLHDDAHESVESNFDTDMDRASMMSWSSRVSGWAEEEAKNAEELHPHL